MPYKNLAQARAFHAKEERGEISHATVKEFDDATDFSTLPRGPKPKSKSGIAKARARRKKAR